MKFYLESNKISSTSIRRAHIANEYQVGICLCPAPLNREKWTLVEALPEQIHLCKSCEIRAPLLIELPDLVAQPFQPDAEITFN